MPTTIHLIRHAQGVHNLSVVNHVIKDPDLTELGHQQCAAVKANFSAHNKISYLVASPLRRTLYTALECFMPLHPDSPAAREGNSKVIATPLLQEVSTNPCDHGSPYAKLHDEFDASVVDLSRAADDTWLNKDKGSPWAPNYIRLRTRAAKVRIWLRQLAGGADTDAHIVVVTHGGFLHFLSDDYDGLTENYGTYPAIIVLCIMRQEYRIGSLQDTNSKASLCRHWLGKY